MTGNGMVDNKSVKCSAWTNTTKAGEKWIKVSIKHEDDEGLPM